MSKPRPVLIDGTDEQISMLRYEMTDATYKAWDSLGRYKFVMFGYWAGVWVHLNRMLPEPEPNPFKELVHTARNHT